MYQFIGETSDTTVGGLEPLLNYMTDNFFSKDDPAINEHHYHITKNNTMNIYIIFAMSIKAKHLILRIIGFLTEQHFNKKQNVNNITVNNITKKYCQ